MISRILRPFAVIAFALCAASAAAQTSQWVAKASMPTARDGMASAVISGKLYVVAGCCSTFNSPFTRFTQVEVYDPATNTWSVPGTETPIPIGVYAPATAYIGDKLYVVGGSASPSDGGNITTIQVYDPSTKTWSSTPMPGAVAAAGSTLLNGKLYVFGGMNGPNTSPVADTRVYDPATDRWAALAPMRSARAWPTATAISGKIYVVGGSNEIDFNSVDIYDPVTDTWSAGAPMPAARSIHAAVAVDGLLYVIGGIQGSTALSSVIVYNPVADAWTQMPSMPTARWLPIAENVGGIIYVVGGEIPNDPTTGAARVTSAVEVPKVLPLSSSSAFITGTTTIGFDDHPVGTATNTLYCSAGVEFRNVNGFPVEIYGWQPLGRITTSQPNVIATVTDFTSGGAHFSTFLDLLFTSPRSEIGAYFGNDQGAGAFTSMTLSVYDALGSAIGSVSVPQNGNTSVDQFIGLRSSVPFSKARFENVGGAGGLSVVLDDVRFTAGTPPVPSLPISTAVDAIQRPFSVAIYHGAMYVADPAAHTVWKVDLGSTTPQKTAVAGTGQQGFNGDGIDATIAHLDNPTGVAVDPANGGTLYIADSGNHAIRKVALGVPGALISTVAGIPTAYAVGESTPPQCLNPSGLDPTLCVPATNLRLFGPRAVALDAAGNLYIADRMNQQIKKLDKASGYIFAIAGVAGVPGRNDGGRADCTIECATPAKLNSPIGVAVDSAGNVYVADEGNNKIRQISPGFVSTVDAGTLLRPTGVAVSGDGQLYIADYGNHRIQRRSTADACSLQTVAGTGTAGSAEGGGVATAAQLNSPMGIAVDGNLLYIADLLNQRIRKVDFTQ